MNAKTILHLAGDVYEVLVSQAPKGTLTYGELCGRLPDTWQTLNPHSPLLAAALGQLVESCRCRELPALSALVINAERGYPGDGYFEATSTSGENAMKKWNQQVHAAKKATYPAKFTDFWALSRPSA
jgi:hypothetical protein